MKKTLYVFLAMVTCIIFITGCSFFNKPDDTTKDDSALTSDTDTADDVTTEDEGEEIPVGNPNDATSEEDTSAPEGDSDSDNESSNNNEASNPRDNIANDASKEYTGTGKYCGFIDSNSVEIELADGSYCSFFVFDEEVRSTLSALDEEDMPEINFTYKAKDGQVNPEMISVIGG
ncbi:MAG: hypothetical protein E7253_09520 [Lachnospiraceae bacterium]|nr:hypothetical protein [Lachnospiraceae bacterium]